MSLMPDSLEKTRGKGKRVQGQEKWGEKECLEGVNREAKGSKERGSEEREGKKAGKSSGFCNLFQLV